MDDPLYRRLPHDNPSNPPSGDRPELHQVHKNPAFYDARDHSWKLRDPDHPLAADPEYMAKRGVPRQQAEASCNLLQLYGHLEYLLPRYQMRYGLMNARGNVINMPYQFIEPKPGWKLLDKNTHKEYRVKSIIRSKDVEHISSFGGVIVLDSPIERFHYLEWQDPNGELDGDRKVIPMVRSEDIKTIAGQVVARGEVSDVKGKPFAPVISYLRDRSEPASVNGQPFSSMKENKYRVRYVVRDPNNPDVIKKIWGQWHENILEFKIYAVGGKVADRLSMWLQNFFLMYTGMLKQLGVQELMPWGFKRDTEEQRTTYDLSCRTFQYYFRLEYLQVESNARLARYEVNLQFFNNLENAGLSSEPDAPQYPVDTSGEPLYGPLIIGDDYGDF